MVWLSQQASHERQPQGQGKSWLGPNLPACPHCSRPTWKGLSQVVSLPMSLPSAQLVHDTQSSLSTWTWNFQVILSDNVSLAPGTWQARSAGRHNIVPDVCNAYCAWCLYMTRKSVYAISYEILSISVKKIDPISFMCRYFIRYCTWYQKKPLISGAEGWQRLSKLTIGPDIEYIFLRYRRKPSIGPNIECKDG